MNAVALIGLELNLVAALMIVYGRIFRTKQTIHAESITSGNINRKEEHHRWAETRVAQAGTVLLVTGFAVQIIGNVFFE